MGLLRNEESLSKKNKAEVRGTATASSGAATCNFASGIITTESLTTTAGSDYTLTLTNGEIRATDDIPFFTVNQLSSAGGPFYTHNAVVTVGQVVVKVRNGHSSTAANGPIQISFRIS